MRMKYAVSDIMAVVYCVTMQGTAEGSSLHALMTLSA
jgi:hypothetical protein